MKLVTVIVGVLLFALATMIIYGWGIVKQKNESQDLMHLRCSASRSPGWDPPPTGPARPTDTAGRRCWPCRRSIHPLRARARVRCHTPAAGSALGSRPCGRCADNTGRPAHRPQRSARWPAGWRPTPPTPWWGCCRPMP